MTQDKTPSEAELLPCPFCGEAAKHSFNSLYGDMSMASCKSCGATAYAPKWNRRAVLAKWGSPVVAGEPYAYAVYFPDQPCEELVHDLADLTEDLTNREHTITELYTTPQPTQAVPPAGREPLTGEQIQDAAPKYYVEDFLDFNAGVRFAEQHADL